MSDNCFKKNELIIPGSRQDERFQKALNPSYVLPDERSIAQLLVFISGYAELINYYMLQGPDQKDYQIEGNWKPLIMSDEAFNYAGIAIHPFTLPNITFYKYVNLYETGSTTAKRNFAYRVLWDILFTVYRDINSFYTALPVYMQLRSVIQTEITNNLISDFGLAAGAYLNHGIAIPSLNLQVPTISTDDEYKFEFADDIIKNGFPFEWIDANLAPLADNWIAYLGILDPNPALAQSFFSTAGLVDEQDRIDYSTLQLKQVFKRAFEAHVRIISIANDFLQQSLHNNSSHFAHHGLLLAFVRLFGILQLDMNDFTRRHLEYYYNRVLRINPAPPFPDSAHIYFDPAKNITSHLIDKNTVLNGGKDDKGKLLLYETDDEIVINQASVEQIKSLFLKPDTTSSLVPLEILKLYASPVSNSADGNGAPFTSEDSSWKGFGDVRIDEVTGNEINTANLGFYIASPILHLTEGKRIIDLTFTTDSTGLANINNLSISKLIRLLSFSFSGEKQWEPLIIDNGVVSDFNCELHFDVPFSGPAFTIRLVMLPQCKAIVGYNATILDGNLSTIYPVIKIVLNQNTTITNGYSLFRGIAINKINITTTVSDITNLSLQNELGTIDASKPVPPFGPNPKNGSAFYIGHPELQFKMLSSIDIKLKWLDYKSNLKIHYRYKYEGNFRYYVPVSNNNGFKAAVAFIRNKDWHELDNSYAIFEDGKNTIISLPVSGLKKSLVNPETFVAEIITFSPQTQNGFIRLVLNAPGAAFGHQKWPKVFAQQTIKFNNTPGENSIPNPPYTPVLESINLTYTATQEINFGTNYNKDQGQFFHQLPFGIKERKKNVLLFPEFEFQKKEADGTLSNAQIESALFIGIGNATINQNISLLIQANEGTEDIAIDPPPVTWNYLSETGWKNFDKSLLADSTLNLLKSGIIKFQVPVDVKTNTTELPGGFIWIMAAVEPDMVGPIQTASDGLPKLQAVYSNAVKATFTDNGNDPEHLAKAVPAHTISKLFESDAAIKKVNQPYATFDGKKIESGKQFYTRVSERLRHKNRAITIWDYERLVLNKYQEVYLVKCLNHTGYEKDCATLTYKYKENIPGHVMLVPVPIISNLQAGNIFQPRLSAAKLTDIKNFIHGADAAGSCDKDIKALHCQLAILLVENPKYETIKVNCKIKVKECLDKIFYRKQLGYDLNKFLSPWITGDPGKINFGGKLHASQVVYFIEQLSYIDYLEDLSIQHKDGATLLNGAEPNLAVGTTSRSVLTSVGNDPDGNPKHNITLL